MNHPDLKPQLTQFGKLADVAAKALVIDMSASYDANKILSNIPRYTSTAAITNDLIKELLIDKTSLRALLAIMLVFSGRKETFYYSTRAQIQNVVKTLSLTGYDMEQIFSIQAKVRHNTVYETDIDVVRNCISHNLFTIGKSGTGYMIHFENIEKGYNFVRDYTNGEFRKFFLDYLLFERLLSILYSISLNIALMKRYLM